MKKHLFFTFLLFLPLFSLAQNPKKVAVWETQCKDVGISNLKREMVRADLEELIDNTRGYIRYDRAMFDAIVGELKFEQSGAVKDDEIMRAGEMAGVQYVVVPQVSIEGDDFYIAVRMIHVEGGEAKTATELCSASSQDIKAACSKLAARLFNAPRVGHNSTNENVPPTASQKKDYVETAFGINMRMVYVEGGTFMMGCTDKQDDCYSDEMNVHQVTVDGFYIGILEVTQSQWEKVMGESMESVVKRLTDEFRIVADYDEPGMWQVGDTIWPSPFCPGEESLKVSVKGKNYPMCLIRYYEAVDFCKKLSEKTGKKYTLPTEAQWEYAARGGNKSKREPYGGDRALGEVAWYGANSNASLHVGGTRKPNALGLYDMLGNVEEWCRDYYMDSYLNYESVNPTGPEDADDEMYPNRVIRGGSYDSEAKQCRVSGRSMGIEQSFNIVTGFRVVCIP